MPVLGRRTDGIWCGKYEGGVDSRDKVFCPGKTCVANWSYNGTTTITYKGCSIYDEGDPLIDYCGEKECKAYTSATSLDAKSPITYHICCCRSEFCNEFVHRNNGAASTTIETGHSTLHTSTRDIQSQRHELPYMASGIFIAVMLFAVFLGRKYFPQAVKCIKSEKTLRSSSTGKSDVIPFTQDLPLSKISEKLAIHEGKYAKILIAKINGYQESICLKEFYTSTTYGRTLYANELVCHTVLCQINHQNIIRYIGKITSSAIGRNSKLAIEYCEQGSLRQYLQANVLTLPTCQKILSDMTCAVSFLHNPGLPNFMVGMAHRDISSGNFLVRRDLSVVITDFGLSFLFSDSSREIKDKTSIAAVGTLNYMAPEALSGTINMNNPVSALKQADVYSMALVMWEVLNRCSALHGEDYCVPEATIPYQTEIKGGKPLYDIVVTDKTRPSFPPIRKSTQKICMHSNTGSFSSSVSGCPRNESAPVTISNKEEGLFITMDHSELSDKKGSSCNDLDTSSKDESCTTAIQATPHRTLALLKRTIQESWDPDEDARLTAPNIFNRVSSCVSNMND